MARKKNETPGMGDNSEASYRVTSNELRQFVERFERLEAEGKDIAEQKKEVMAEAKARGYDTKVLRKIIAERKRDKDDVAEELAVLELYREALGMASSYDVSEPSDPDEEEDDDEGMI